MQRYFIKWNKGKETYDKSGKKLPNQPSCEVFKSNHFLFATKISDTKTWRKIIYENSWKNLKTKIIFSETRNLSLKAILMSLPKFR